MRPPRSQRGLAAATIIIVLILAVVALLLGRSAWRSAAELDRRGVTDASLARVSKALVEFATLNRRLPCPARGNLDTGDADPDAATATCTTADGVVPWRTLALRSEDALDGWGHKISYRVFDGAAGLTQADGASMSNCNTSLGAPIDATLAAGSLCKPGGPPPNTPAQFLAARATMLVVEDQGTTRNGNAFVLISHGETGYGAYVAEAASGRTTLPSAGGKEIVNTQAGGTYWILPQSAPGIAPDDPAHFDDSVAYMTLADLVAKAKLDARSWSEFPLSAQFSTSAVEAAVPGFDHTTSQDTGLTSLAMGGFLVTAGSSVPGASNNGFREQNGVGGIGAIGGGSTSGDLNSFFGERLTFQLGTGSEFSKMDVALNAFEITDSFPLQKERAEISFWRGGDPVQTATVDAWDDLGNPSRCLFRLASGGIYDRMDVAPVPQTGGGGSTRFTVAALMACTDPTTPCATAVPGAVACPILPPSAVSGSATASATAATLQGTVEDNEVAKGTGSGYLTTAAGFPFGTRSIPLTSGSGTILTGNCLTIAGDANTYVVAAGIASPGTLVLAAPGLRQPIPASATPVTVTHCVTTVNFDYGLTCAYGSSAASTPATINGGAGSTSVSGTIGSGLTCNTSYYFRTRATSGGGTTTGADKTFTTAACAYPTPGAATDPPTGVDTAAATLHGVANDNGASTSVTFDYGPTSCYGSSAAATPATITAGAGATAVSASLAGLACNTHYHYRARAVSAAGTTTGSDVAFLTAPCP